MKSASLVGVLMFSVTSFAAAPAAKRPPKVEETSPSVRGIRQVALDASTLRRAVTVNVAAEAPTYLFLPESIPGTPTCSSCGSDDKPRPGALFVLKSLPEERAIVVQAATRPKTEGGSGPNAADFNTILSLTLGGSPKPLMLKLAYAKANASDTVVRLLQPEAEKEALFVVKQLDEERAKLETNFEKRVKVRSLQVVHEYLLSSHECRPIRSRGRDGNIRLFVEELCRFGKRFFLVFKLSNRSEAVYSVADIIVAQGAGTNLTPVDAVAELLPERDVRSTDQVQGVLSFDVVDEKRLDEGFEIRVLEHGGMNREVVATF
jgi:hypothetical protein